MLFFFSCFSVCQPVIFWKIQHNFAELAAKFNLMREFYLFQCRVCWVHHFNSLASGGKKREYIFIFEQVYFKPPKKEKKLQLINMFLCRGYWKKVWKGWPGGHWNKILTVEMQTCECQFKLNQTLLGGWGSTTVPRVISYQLADEKW